MDQSEKAFCRYLDGDEEAFSEILEEYRFRLIFFINRYTHDVDAAEDIAMDVFAHLIAHPKKYRLGSGLGTYLFLLAKSRALDYVRRRNHFTWVNAEDTLPSLADEQNLEEEVLQNEVARVINGAISELPKDMQTVIHLVYFENFSYKEVAAIMKKSPKWVDNLLYRAKDKLKNLLGKEGEALL